jgi:hypothetical protein
VKIQVFSLGGDEISTPHFAQMLGVVGLLFFFYI